MMTTTPDQPREPRVTLTASVAGYTEAMRAAAWSSTLGLRARDARRILDDLADTRAAAVPVSPERLRAWSTLIADLVEGGPRA